MIRQPADSAMVDYVKRSIVTRTQSVVVLFIWHISDYFCSISFTSGGHSSIQFNNAMDNLICILKETNGMIRWISRKEKRLRWISVWMGHEWMAQYLFTVMWVAVLLKLCGTRVGGTQVHE